MKKIGFLSFGHWTPSPRSQARSAADVLLQSIDLAMEAERLGMDGAYFRVHHFAQQLASPFVPSVPRGGVPACSGSTDTTFRPKLPPVLLPASSSVGPIPPPAKPE